MQAGRPQDRSRWPDSQEFPLNRTLAQARPNRQPVVVCRPAGRSDSQLVSYWRLVSRLKLLISPRQIRFQTIRSPARTFQRVCQIASQNRKSTNRRRRQKLPRRQKQVYTIKVTGELQSVRVLVETLRRLTIYTRKLPVCLCVSC